MAPQVIAGHSMPSFLERGAIAGRYELRAEQGAGEAAVVYRAFDRLLGREVAFKALNPRYGADATLVARFRQAVAVACSLDHPNVARVFDYGVVFDYNASTDGSNGVPGVPFVVTELVPGGDLRQALRQHGLLPEPVALALVARVAAALAAAHEAGLVHGDLKPQNVLLDERGAPKVTDFGLAQAIGRSQALGSASAPAATPYLSPEQAQGRVVDGRSDLYSLGVLLYELLTDQLPFSGVSMLAIVMRHVQQGPGQRREVLPLFSPSTGAVILKALAKDPVERFQTAAEMRQAVEQARIEAVDAGAGPASPAEVTTLLASSAAARQSTGQPADAPRPGVADATEEAPPQPGPPLRPAGQLPGSAAVSPRKRRPGIWRLAGLLTRVMLSGLHPRAHLGSPSRPLPARRC